MQRAQWRPNLPDSYHCGRAFKVAWRSEISALRFATDYAVEAPAIRPRSSISSCLSATMISSSSNTLT